MHLPRARARRLATGSSASTAASACRPIPSGEGVFNTGGAFNAGQYSNPALDKLINQSTVVSSLAAYKAYENIVVKEEPWIWTPVPDHIAATSKNLRGYGMTSEFTDYYGYIEPKFWSFTK